MKQLNGLDAMFVHTERHGLPMHVSSLSIYDPSTAKGGRVEFRQIIELFAQCVQRHVPVLHCKLMHVPFNLDQPYWIEDANFDLVYHMRHIALPEPGNWSKLCSLVANLHAQPLSRERPLWEAYIIDGLDHVEGIPAGSFALLLKIHHSAMDGQTGMAIYTHLHTLSAEPHCTLEDHPDKNSTGRAVDHIEASTPRLLARAFANNLRKTGGGLASMLSHPSGWYKSARQILVYNKDHKRLSIPKTRFNGNISPRRVVDRIRAPLSDIKLIKSAVDGATINDVALTIIGGALRRYLQSKDELPETSLVSAVPINVRSPDDDHVSGNRISITNIPLRTDIVDPLVRLRAIHRAASPGKAYARTTGKNMLNDVMDNLYAGIASWGARAVMESGVLEKLPPLNNTVVTNVIGTPVPLYLCGAKLVDSFGLGTLIPNTGLFHSVSSTCDFLAISITADRQKMGDPDFYARCLEASFHEMLAAVQAEQAPEPATKAELKSVTDNSGNLEDVYVENKKHRRRVAAS